MLLIIVGGYFKHPETVLWVGGRMFVSDIGEFGKRDGKVYMKEGRRWSVWASYLKDPKGLAHCGGVLYVADVDRVWAVKDRSAVFEVVGPKDFTAQFLNGITCARGGKLYVSDTYGNAIYLIDPRRRTVKKVLSVEKPNGLAVDGRGNLYVITFTSPGRLLRWNGSTLDTVLVSSVIDGGDGLVYVSDRDVILASGYESGKVVKVSPNGRYSVIAQGLRTPAGIGFDGRYVYVPLLELGEIKRFKVF
ncbi:MAG: hypothetical protein GXO29_07565 [Thermotogae bacterium]|nr:hypothetical protein [Thermotogota bacterium]